MTTGTEEITLESLQAEIAQLRRQRLEERQQIIDIARRAASDNGMCEVVDRALTRAGLLGGEQVTIQANVPIQITTWVDTGYDIPTIQAFLNSHTETIQNVLADGLGHVKAVSYGNVRNQDARISLNGEIQVVTVEQGAPARTAPARNVRQLGDDTNNWARPPQGYLALYTRPQGRLVHFVYALDSGNVRTAERVSHGGMDWYVARVPLCAPSRPILGWQFHSTRAEGVGGLGGICTECSIRARNQYGWRFA